MAINDITRLGTDVRKIARLLQAKAPPGHNLAYITPEEAQILKDRGGSGKPHADTGIPSYEVEYDPLGDLPPAYTEQFGAPDTTPASPEVSGGTDYFANILPPTSPLPRGQFREGAPLSQAAFQQAVPSIELPPSPKYGFGEGAAKLAETVGQPAAPAAGGAGAGILKQLGMGLAQAIPGALMARRAQRQAGETGAAMQEVAAPYRQLGQQLQAAAGRGELAPAAQQSLQAAQAQLAQQAQARGGVGAAQVQTQIEAFRQQLLQQQMDYGLKLSGIGDQIALGAIRAGAQADQYVNQLTSQFMNNLFRQFQPAQPAAPATPPGG